MNRRVFVGRRGELAAVGGCLEAARAGQSQVVWIEGEAGSGKTALISQVLDGLPAGVTVLRAGADELAAETPLAVVAQLGPVESTGPLRAGMDLLRLLDAYQDGGPVVVVVEDLHWADTVSRQALLAMARRLDEDRVTLIVSSRPTPAMDDGWERLSYDAARCRRLALGSLSAPEVGDLSRQLGRPLSREDADRLHRHTRGHPLHLWTLLTELSAEQLVGSSDSLPAPRSLASTTAARVAGLPAPSRELVAALAVLNQRVPLSLAGRVAGVDRPTEALDGLLDTGLVAWWPGEPRTPVEVAHPLYRAAIYEDLSPIRRQALHRAAAEFLDPAAALPHRVAAADRVDDELAGELEAAALRSADDGSHGMAATYLLWASSLTSARPAAEERLLRAARILLADGRTARVTSLRPRLLGCEPGALRSLVLGTLALNQGDTREAEAWLLDAVDRHRDGQDGAGRDRDGRDRAGRDRDGGGDVRLAALATLGVSYCHQGRPEETYAVAQRAVALEPSDNEWGRPAWVLLAVGEGLLRGAPAGLDRLGERFPLPAEAVAGPEADVLVTRAMLGYYAGRTWSTVADLRKAIDLAREGWPMVQLTRAHLHLAQLLVAAGEWDEALLHGRLAVSMAADGRPGDESLPGPGGGRSDDGVIVGRVGRYYVAGLEVGMETQAHATLATLSAYRGDWAAADRHMASARSTASLEAYVTTLFTEATIARARQRPDDVVAAVRPLAGTGDDRSMAMISSLMWWPLLVESLLDDGDLGAAEEEIGHLERAADQRRLDYRARLAGMRARLAAGRGDRGAADGFDQALDSYPADAPRLDKALLHQAYGRFLLQHRDRKRAVGQLRTAHDHLADMRAEPFRRAVAADLDRCGIPSDGAGRPRSSRLALSEREQDVVALVAKGLTNREVADQMYLSEKAIEYHLRNVFGKLGITSRRELRHRAVDGP